MSDSQALIDALWEEFVPLVEARVVAIEGLAEALELGAPPELAIATAAQHAAHTLVGALGTYGRPHSSEIASVIDHLVSSRTPNAATLRSLIADLREAIDDHA